jgi:NAD(P)-dependent dehydrogenase (short-subunit alcohol dehydrogenase family)
MEHQLKGKIAVVTGGNSGIGYATAKELRAQGATVIITGRNKASIEKAAAELDVKGIVSDQSDLSQIDALAAEVKQTNGSVDILFINAGVAFFSPIEAATEAHFDEIMNINFKGAYFTLSKFIPLLNAGAAVTMLSSINATAGMAGSSVYAASKAAMNSLVKVASTELAPKGIRVNAVSPGPINTPIFGKIGMDETTLNGFAGAMQNRIPLKRFGAVEEVARLVVFLSGPDGAFTTGAEYIIDGGTVVNPIMS